METLKQDIKERIERGMTFQEAVLETILELEFMGARKATIRTIIKELTREIEDENQGK